MPDQDPKRPAPLFMSQDSEERKRMPVASGVAAYFPRALRLVAYQSWIGNEKHNPGEPLHWATEKSADEPDAELRHMLDHFQGVPPDANQARLGKLAHKTAKAWRALADLERACRAEEAEFRAAPPEDADNRSESEVEFDEAQEALEFFSREHPVATTQCDRCGESVTVTVGGLCQACDRLYTFGGIKRP